MLIDEWAITFNLFSIAVLGLLAATLFLSLVWLFSSNFILELSAQARKVALGLFVAMPWFASLFCMLIFMPSLIQLNQFEWLGNVAHWHHPYVFNVKSWHGLVLLISTVTVSYVLIRKLSITLYHLNSLKTLTGLSHKENQHFSGRSDIVVLDSQNPSAFTAGLFKPRCYITTGLICQVSENELNIIIDHERAHIRYRDTWSKLFFSLFVALYPKPLARKFSQLFSLAIEQLADAYVSKSYNRFDIAKTLVKTARIQLNCAKSSIAPIQVFFVADDVACRVRELVAPGPNRSFPWFFCILLLVVTPLISSYGVDGLHHFVESFFSH